MVINLNIFLAMEPFSLLDRYIYLAQHLRMSVSNAWFFNAKLQYVLSPFLKLGYLDKYLLMTYQIDKLTTCDQKIFFRRKQSMYLDIIHFCIHRFLSNLQTFSLFLDLTWHKYYDNSIRLFRYTHYCDLSRS